MKNLIAILFDLGDTIMDEGAEVKDAGETTLAADLISGMAETLRWLHAQGYPLAIVADARPDTPLNVLKQHDLLDLFESLSVSETVGAEKPDARLFLHALQALNIAEEDYPRVMMVGNNLERDIAGANRLGLRSVYFHVNDRRRSIPLSRVEAPRHTITSAQDLLDLVTALAVNMPADQPPHDPGKPEELELVAAFAPLICFDEAEPFLPLAVGYTIFKGEEPSPSFFRRIRRDWRPAWATAIEYAIWWDWDIGHLYELEHVWVYLDEADRLIWVEASSHGGYASMILEDGTIPCDGTHPIVYSQPGKHAFSPTPHWFTMFRDLVCQAVSDYAGAEGVLIKEQYVQQIPESPEINALVGNWLRRKAFTPTLKFSRQFQIRPDQLVPWPMLDAWIPARVNWWIDRLREGERANWPGRSARDKPIGWRDLQRNVTFDTDSFINNLYTVVKLQSQQSHSEVIMEPLRYFIDTHDRANSTFPAALTPQDFEGFYAKYEQACYAEGVIPVRVHVGYNEGRAFCLTLAPNAEAVRRAHERVGLPFDSITEVLMATPGDTFFRRPTA